MRTARSISVIVLLCGMTAAAHRLDEYLQGTLISVEKGSVRAQMTLTPGVAVLPVLMATIDTDRDGAISPAEQRAYAGRVLRDLSLTIGGRSLTARLTDVQFPSMAEMADGRGEIAIEFSADVPRGSGHRKLVLENRHQSAIAAYQVNCLVSRDPEIQIISQTRNYTQSVYQLDYFQTETQASMLLLGWWTEGGKWVGLVALLLAMRFALMRRSQWQRRPTP